MYLHFMKFLIKHVNVLKLEDYVLLTPELVGLVPKKVLIDAGVHFLKSKNVPSVFQSKKS